MPTRRDTLDAAYALHPARFPNGPPKAALPPAEVHINPLEALTVSVGDTASAVAERRPERGRDWMLPACSPFVTVDACEPTWHAGDVTRDLSDNIAPLVAELEAALRDPSGASWEADLDDAVKELGELGAIEAIPLLLRICDATDGLSFIHEACGKALSKMGARGVEPLLDAYSRSTNRDTRNTLDYALAELGVRDPRILALLLDLLEDNPDHGAGVLGEYGDPDALPALEGALDRFQIGSKGDGPFANHAVIELAAAIKVLGGVVSDAGLVKLGMAQRLGRTRSNAVWDALGNLPKVNVERAPAARRPKLGRNDPCWCGSGKKYKRCHRE